MSKFWRSSHVSTRNGKVFPVSGSFVNKTGKKGVAPVKEEGKHGMSSGLQEIESEGIDLFNGKHTQLQELTEEELEELKEMINLPADQQIKIMVNERDLLKNEIERAPKVGYTADLVGATERKKMLECLDVSIQFLKGLTLEQLKQEISSAEKLISSSRVGFTATPFSTNEIRDYLEELECRMEDMMLLGESRNIDS